MTSHFFAVISVPLACARLLQGCSDHRGVTLDWLWFLDQALGFRLGVHFKIQPCSPSFPPFISLGQQNGHTPALGLWRPGHTVLQTNSIIYTMKKRANKHTNVYIHMYSFYSLCLLCTARCLLCTSASVVIISTLLKYAS